jgi:hypothetical protein
MLKSIDKKIDEISTMLDDNIPIIEESQEKQSSTLTYLSCLMPSLETIMKSKVLQSAIAKTVGAGRNKGDVSTSFRREEPFNRHV